MLLNISQHTGLPTPRGQHSPRPGVTKATTEEPGRSPACPGVAPPSLTLCEGDTLSR